jgi:hypothetical protein
MSKIKNPSPVEIKAGNELLANWLMCRYETYTTVDSDVIPHNRTLWVLGNPVDINTCSKMKSYVLINDLVYETSQCFLQPPNFHESWDWLMQVTNKVISSGFKIPLIQSKDWSVVYISKSFTSTEPIISSKKSTLLEAYWSALVEFVKLQNQKSC